MTHLDHLLRAITDPRNFSDDGLRLAYADELEEQGQQERGEFVKVQVVLARMPFTCALCKLDYEEGVELDLTCAHEMSAPLRRRERELLGAARGVHGNLWQWLQPSPRAGPPFIDSESEYGWVTTSGPPNENTRCLVTFRRGFVHTVRCRLSEWTGAECHLCQGTGDGGPSLRCYHCHGTGTVPGVGKLIVRQQPVEVVETERRPFRYGGRHFAWRSNEGPPDYNEIEEYDLPPEVFRLLGSGYIDDAISVGGDRRGYATAAAAHAALSAALLKIARKEPLIKGVTHGHRREGLE